MSEVLPDTRVIQEEEISELQHSIYPSKNQIHIHSLCSNSIQSLVGNLEQMSTKAKNRKETLLELDNNVIKVRKTKNANK